MKKTIFIFTGIVIFLAGTLFVSCQSPAEKVDDSQSAVQDAKQNLKDAQNDANAAAQGEKVAATEEWKAFKSASEEKIKNNEAFITDLKAKMKASGKKVDAAYEKSIDALEQKNKDLTARMDAYDKGPSDWESFKTEFNHDMDGLGQALKDLTVKNTK